MPKEFKELAGWSFETNEVSTGVYKVSGSDRAGRNVEATGIDPEALLEKCKQAALQLAGDLRNCSKRTTMQD